MTILEYYQYKICSSKSPLKVRRIVLETIKINGMKCPHCSSSVTKSLDAIEGLNDINVDLDNNEASFTNSGNVDRQTIKDAISKIGFEPAE